MINLTGYDLSNIAGGLVTMNYIGNNIIINIPMGERCEFNGCYLTWQGGYAAEANAYGTGLMQQGEIYDGHYYVNYSMKPNAIAQFIFTPIT